MNYQSVKEIKQKGVKLVEKYLPEYSYKHSSGKHFSGRRVSECDETWSYLAKDPESARSNSVRSHSTTCLIERIALVAGVRRKLKQQQRFIRAAICLRLLALRTANLSKTEREQLLAKIRALYIELDRLSWLEARTKGDLTSKLRLPCLPQP